MSYGEEIKVWNTGSGALLKVIRLPGLSSSGSAIVSSIAVSNDGSLLAAGRQEGDIMIWEARSGRQLLQWKDGSDDILLSKTARSSFSVTPGVWQVALSPDGKTLATASGDDTVRLWEPRTGKLLHAIKTPTGQSHPPLVFSPDGKWLASSSTRTSLSNTGRVDSGGRLWNVKTGKLHARLPGQGATISAFAFSPDSRSVASGDGKGLIRIWKIP